MIQDLNNKYLFQVDRYNRIIKDLKNILTELKVELPSLANIQILSDDGIMKSEAKRMAENIEPIISVLQEVLKNEIK